MTTVTIQGLDRLDRRLGRLAAIEVIKPPITKSIALLHGLAMTYPTASGKPMQWKSLKQRRWFFAALHDGRIQVPYVPTMNLSGGWTEKVEVRGQTVVGILGNDVQYGPWVMGAESQAEYHKGTWPTTEQIVNDAKADIVTTFEKAIREALNG